MRVQLHADFLNHSKAEEAKALIGDCVHCGFCLSACPTFQVLGNECDSPRGRIDLIKNFLESKTVTHTLDHLDQCLTCRACEPVCPSHVHYGRLLEIGKSLVEDECAKLPRRLSRKLLASVLPNPQWYRLARKIHYVLPPRIRRKIPENTKPLAWPQPKHRRRFLLLRGCVQDGVMPGINAVAARLADRIGVSLIPADIACCGALPQHLGDEKKAAQWIKDNLESLQLAANDGIEGILTTASGCSLFMQGYNNSPLPIEDFTAFWYRHLDQLTPMAKQGRRVAIHEPCTLQNGLQLGGVMHDILAYCGYEIVKTENTIACCGSAGAYSLLHPEIAEAIRAIKLQGLTCHAPEVIATANIGCLLYLGEAANIAVRHWAELVEEAFCNSFSA